MAEFFRDDLSPEPRRQLTKGDMVRSRIPRDFWSCELDKIPATMPYVHELKAYVENMHITEKQGRGLYLHANVYGTGKTGAAVSILKEAMRRGGRGLFISAIELEAIFGKNGDSERLDHDPEIRLSEAIHKTHFLVLDDLGAEKSIPWSPPWVERIIKLRNNGCLPTLITSNDDPIILMERVQSIASILGGRYDGIEIKGINWRLDSPLTSNIDRPLIENKPKDLSSPPDPPPIDVTTTATTTTTSNTPEPTLKTEQDLESEVATSLEIKPEEIMAARKNRKLNQASFGALLGVCRLTISNWETGKVRVSKRYLTKLQELLKGIDNGSQAST